MAPLISWMRLADECSRKSNCIRRSVGAVVVRDGKVIASGWNGVVGNYENCREAGCPRCIEGGTVGFGYDMCLCIHAEQKAIGEAARNGVSIDGAEMYITLRPCLGCLAMMRSAGIKRVFYAEDWTYPTDVERSYRKLAEQFEIFEICTLVGTTAEIA